MRELRGLSLALGLVLLAPSAPASAARRPSLQAYFQVTLEDDAYQKRTFQRVAERWKSPAASAYPKVGAKSVVRAVIAKDGRLVSTELSTSSGSKGWDDAALAAVKKSAPFEPLPPGYAYTSLEVHFHVSVVEG